MLFETKFAGAYCTRSSLGGEITRNVRHFREAPWYGILLPKERSKLEARTMIDVCEVYRELKNCFLSSARYEDASWAHFRERQTERYTLHPLRSHKYYSNVHLKGKPARSLRWWWSYSRLVRRWLLALAVELSCGYGERPLRAVLWSALIVFAFAWLFQLRGGIASNVGAKLTWFDYLNYSLGAFTTMGFDRFSAITPATQALTSLEASMGISMLALLMFALGNRIAPK